MAIPWKPEPINYLERPVRLTEAQIEDLLLFLGARSVKNKNDNLCSDHCFLHGNDSPTLGVSSNYPYPFNCFSCPPGKGRGPDIICLVQQALKLPRNEAYSLLVSRYSLSGLQALNFRRHLLLESPKARFVLPETALAAYPLDQDNNIGYRAAAYYLGATREQADMLGLGYRLRGHYIIFPIRHQDGKLAGLVGRCQRPNHTKAERWLNFDTGAFDKSQVLLGHHLPLADEPVIIVEGPKDYCRMRMLGWMNTRAILGKDSSDFQLSALLEYKQPLVVLLDHDAPGRAAAARLTRSIRAKGMRTLSYTFPQAAFDADGKGDPGMLTPESFKELVGSFKLMSLQLPAQRCALPR